jgi:hypothetical protein
VESGFWSISRGWDTPWSLRGAGSYSGGKTFFEPIPPDLPVEGMLHIGEAADAWWWSMQLCHEALWAGEEFWNGPAPDGTNKQEYDEFMQSAANACVRYNEAVNLKFEYPSWRTGMQPRFFTVDISKQCNRSHIDDGAISGLGRSGPKEGMLAQGPASDYRRVPLGTSDYAGVPFEIIDPAKNRWKSMILVGDAAKSQLLPGAQNRVAIPIGRKAASLCVLRCIMRRDPISGGQYDYWNVVQPVYVYEYADGTRYVCDRELARHFAMITAETFPQPWGAALPSYLWPSTRIGLFTNTLGGGGAFLFLNEFVNPYPEKVVSNLIIQLPNPEERQRTFAWHEALFAVTGVEPTDWDEKFWKRQPAAPLLPPNSLVPEGLTPLAGAALSREHGDAWLLQLPASQSVGALSFRLAMPVWGEGMMMPVWQRHADCKVSGSDDGKTWTPLGEIKGCTAMDGEHVLTFAEQRFARIRVELDSTSYTQEEHTGIGVLSSTVFVRAAK